LKGSRTEKNLVASFAGESQARNRYTYFSEVARREGYEQIAEIFLETAENEKEHAKIFFSLLKGGDVGINVSYPAGVIGNTLANLKASADGENKECKQIYIEAEKTAREEGFKEIGDLFKRVALAEEYHEKRYRALFNNITDGKVFKKDAIVKWKCRNCGYVHEGKEAPGLCPLCRQPEAYYEILKENY